MRTNRAFASEDGPIAARKFGLVIDRHIDGGLHEIRQHQQRSKAGVHQPGDCHPRWLRQTFLKSKVTISFGAAV
jgi:hypothetical protein